MGKDRAPTVYGHDSVEFGRVTTFSDGVFAIAMTLLVIAIDIPKLREPGSVEELLTALDDLVPNFIGFVVSFAVIGRYWVAHHQMFSLLHTMNPGLIGRNLVYLMFVAFLPFPTALLGDYFGNPVAVAAYALTAAVVSGMEVVLLRYANRAGLLKPRPTGKVMRWATIQSTFPVAAFLVSVPVAFLNTTVAVLVWFASFPFGIVMRRRRPLGAEALNG